MRRAGAGQAALELLAAVPAVVLAGLLAWQLAAVLAAGMRAQELVRAEALRAGGPGGRTVLVRAQADVPRVLPGVGRLRVPAAVGVRTP